MQRTLFLRIVERVCQVDNYFHQKTEATGKPGIHPIAKVTAALRVLCYDIPSDAADEYLKIGDSTAREFVKRFCAAIKIAFGDEHFASSHARGTSRDTSAEC